RVLLLRGAPAVQDAELQALSLRVFAGMLSDEGDMKLLAPSVSPDPVRFVANTAHVTFTAGEGNEDVRAYEHAARAVAGHECGEQRWLYRFFGHVAAKSEYYHASYLTDPDPRRMMGLGANVDRWCKRRGLSVLSAVTVLGDLVRE